MVTATGDGYGIPLFTEHHAPNWYHPHFMYDPCTPAWYVLGKRPDLLAGGAAPGYYIVAWP